MASKPGASADRRGVRRTRARPLTASATAPRTRPTGPVTIDHPVFPRPLVIPPDDGTFSHDEIASLYWTHHPRFHFLKMASARARVFDIGAGWGRLSFWREWMSPDRRDLEMHGCDLFPARFADQYASFHVMNIDGARFPHPDGYFGAAIASHLIEHLQRPGRLAAELARTIAPGGQVYIETPTAESVNFPDRHFFLDHGCPTTTTNFADDDTHAKPIGRDELRRMFEHEGFILREAGTIKHPYLEVALLSKAVTHDDQELGSYGLWSILGFAHYAIFSKPVA
ncbi:MAG TPA: methyltransferase domain-containing protein [Candidatus Didemnitutus sp.]|jgi:SAM-dependent methyltransferase